MSDRRPERREPVLEMRNVSTHYGLVSVLRNVDVQIYAGEMVCLLGGNASGKTTTLKTILGYVTPSEGEVLLDGEVVSGLPTIEVVRRGRLDGAGEPPALRQHDGVGEPGARRVPADGSRGDRGGPRATCSETFPRVRERLKQKAGTLSGGEQQMVAMGRALMASPRSC